MHVCVSGEINGRQLQNLTRLPEKTSELTNCWGVALVSCCIINLRMFMLWRGFIHVGLLQEQVRRLGGMGRNREDGLPPSKELRRLTQLQL